MGLRAVGFKALEWMGVGVQRFCKAKGLKGLGLLTRFQGLGFRITLTP